MIPIDELCDIIKRALEAERADVEGKMKIQIQNEAWLYRTFGLGELRCITREWNRIWQRSCELESLERRLELWKREEAKAVWTARFLARHEEAKQVVDTWRRLKLRILSVGLAKRHGVEHFEDIYGILSARYAAPHMWQIVRERRIARAKKRGLELSKAEIDVSDDASRLLVRTEQTVPGYVACAPHLRPLFFREIYA